MFVSLREKEQKTKRFDLLFSIFIKHLHLRIFHFYYCLFFLKRKREKPFPSFICFSPKLKRKAHFNFRGWDGTSGLYVKVSPVTSSVWEEDHKAPVSGWRGSSSWGLPFSLGALWLPNTSLSLSTYVFIQLDNTARANIQTFHPSPTIWKNKCSENL